jgi:hypothetical protein
MYPADFASMANVHKPLATTLKELATLSKEVGALESSWKKLSDDDVASFNKMLTSSGVSYIALAGK